MHFPERQMSDFHSSVQEMKWFSCTFCLGLSLRCFQQLQVTRRGDTIYSNICCGGKWNSQTYQVYLRGLRKNHMWHLVLSSLTGLVSERVSKGRGFFTPSTPMKDSQQWGIKLWESSVIYNSLPHLWLPVCPEPWISVWGGGQVLYRENSSPLKLMYLMSLTEVIAYTW